MDESTVLEAVLKAKEYIAAGDAYQIVVSRRLTAARPPTRSPCTAALRTINPSPYLFFFRLGKTTVVGSSPEVLCAWGRPHRRAPNRGDESRGVIRVPDQTIAETPAGRPKERAEHVMLVDRRTERPSGRVATLARSKVTEFMEHRRYSHVMHLVST